VVAVGDPWRNLIPRLTEDLGTDGNLVTWVETVDDAVREVAAALDR
jgi:hypothetical protein